LGAKRTEITKAWRRSRYISVFNNDKTQHTDRIA
jgi:hypothetical protein